MELLRRKKAQEGLMPFVKYTMPEFEDGEHHDQIVEALEAVERGDIDRLMIFAPPRHTKSELASRRFPAWYLGRHPDNQIIQSTYSGEFALDFGRDVKKIVSSPEFNKIFPDVTLAADSKANNRFRTNGKGIAVYVGVGGAVTGRGAHIALIDDPFKNRQEADSEVRRETVWKWYTSTLRTRLMPNGAIILILTRWHEDDLAGRLLERQGRVEDGGEWTVVELPAIKNEGTDHEEALWPEWFDLDNLHRTKRDIGQRDWSALYQQKPTPDEGDYFRRDWVRWYDREELPKCYNYIYSDYATKDGSGDFTVHMVIGVGTDGTYYIRDMWRGQKDAGIWVDSLFNLESVYKPLKVWGEKGGIYNTVLPSIKKQMKTTKQYFRIDAMASVADKPTRARAFQALMANGKVRFPRGKEWVSDLITELLHFPAGKHDDMVDTLSMMARQVDTMKTPENVVKKDKSNSGYDPYKSNNESKSWRM